MKTWVVRALVLLVGIVVGGIMVVLGLWQMGVSTDAAHAEAQDRAKLPAVQLSEALGDDATAAYGRTVSAKGSFTGEPLLVGTAAPLRTVWALRLNSGSVLPVVFATCGELAAGPASVEGVFLFTEKHESKGSRADLGSVRLSEIAQLWPEPVVTGYVVASADTAQSLGCTAAEPELPTTGGPWRNIGYALQWWAFAAFGIGMAILIARRIT